MDHSLASGKGGAAKERMDALTSLRFFASAMIVIHHVNWYFTFLKPVADKVTLDLGVSFFPSSSWGSAPARPF